MDSFGRIGLMEVLNDSSTVTMGYTKLERAKGTKDIVKPVVAIDGGGQAGYL
jgi:hypothetical protein